MPPGSRERVTPSGPIEEARWLRTKSPRWSAGKARLPSDRQAGAFARGAQYKTCADPALRPPRGATKAGRKPGKRTERSDDPPAACRADPKTCAQLNRRPGKRRGKE